MKKSKLIALTTVCCASMACYTALADTTSNADNSNNGLIYSSVEVNSVANPVANGVSGGAFQNAPAKFHEIALIPLTKVQKEYLQQKAGRYLTSGQSSDSTLMNDNSGNMNKLGAATYSKGNSSAISSMPVLDQGTTGTCATFSTTAGLDILTQKSTDNYNIYDSLCMGVYLSEQDAAYFNQSVANELTQWQSYDNNGNLVFPNPWNGSVADIVLSQDSAYGMVNGQAKDDQDGQFANNSSSKQINPSSASYNFVAPAFTMTPLYGVGETASFSNSTLVKNALDHGKLVVIGIPVDDSNNMPQYSNGMLMNIYPDANVKGQYDIGNANAQNLTPDAWVCSEQIASDINNNVKGVGGHAVLVTGYIPSSTYGGGGFFVIRNSWGSSFGSNGNCFVSFDYLNNYSTDGVAISA